MPASLKAKLGAMKWATSAIEQLGRGARAQIQPRGHSMSPLIVDGQQVSLEPIASSQLRVGDIVLARVSGKKRPLIVLHQILQREDDLVLIGAQNGRVNGWIETVAIFGRVASVAPEPYAG